ncbi:RidA family protein [Agromyces allii]|uniref:RidA family protein n=1 Tax=Agromyces allii TaxID=393607 RepID=A0ABP5CFE0_9MICO|nr:RidA family protein [Agromyces allii]
MNGGSGLPDVGLRRIPADADDDALSADAVVVGGTVYATVIPTDERDELAGSSIAAQAEQAIANLDEVLRSAGSDLASVAHLTIHLTDIARDRAGFNAVYREWFPSDRVPVRCAVGVAALARPGMLVELTAIAAVTASSVP